MGSGLRISKEQRMVSPLLGQVLGAVFANAARRRGVGGGFGGGLGGAALGGLLGGALGRRRGFGGKGAILALLLPVAMQWVQRNGGLGAVLQRARQRGLDPHATSWVSTGDNQPLDDAQVQQLVGDDDIADMSRTLGVPPEEVRQGFAEILPEVVNQLTPEGRVPDDADGVLDESIPLLRRELEQAERAPAA
jgi:uncharacterized protein YidB (DUF937 family)